MSDRFDMTPIFEAMSAMQKYIRRNMQREALYHALKIEEFNPKMLWNRLEVIVVEDIGVADHTKITTIHTLKGMYEDSMNRGKYGGLFLSAAIQLLATGPKSWDAGALINIVHIKRQAEYWKPIMPDWVFDKHTLRGKQMGKGIENFFDESITMAENETDVEMIKECRELCVKHKILGSKKISRKITAMNAWGKQKTFVKEKNPQTSLVDSF